MADKRRVLACFDQTPTASGKRETGRTTTRLPEELLSEQAQRLVVFSIVAFAIWGFAMFMDAVVLPGALDGWERNWRNLVLEFFGTLGAAVMALYLSTSHATPERKAEVGLGFMLLNALLIAGINAWAMPPEHREVLHLSWTTILILIYSMIAPGTPRRILAGSLAAAVMDPLAYGAAALAGLPTPTAVQVFALCWPNVACALIAVLPSRVLQRVGRRLSEAQELGSYQLVELLGHGGMGEVWRAEHRLLARDAAIKLVRPDVLGARNDAEARAVLRRFEREAQATAMLGSPHTIQVFDFGMTNDNTFYYVMELLHGRDLESLVREFGPLPANRVIYLLRQVCHSLADAHARGLVHRDIKPANIYVCRMGLEYDFVKVLDFGLVKFKDRVLQGTDTLATLDHTTTGTPAYMAPETILGEAEVDRRADVYALGCVAYYLLTGQLVFEAESSMKMLMQHLHAQPVPPSHRTELPIPRDLDDLVLACLQKDPNLRPQNAGELFRMACECRTCEGWNTDMAQAWWDVHLPELSGPLTLTRPDIAKAGAGAAAAVT